VKNVFIPTSNVTAFREAAIVVSDTVKGQPGLMVAWGYAGRGKTECSREYAVRNPGAVYVRVQENWTPRAMLAKICYELNGMRPHRVDLAKQVIIISSRYIHTHKHIEITSCNTHHAQLMQSDTLSHIKRLIINASGVHDHSLH